MEIEDVFKLYYIGWQQKFNIKEYREFSNAKNDLILCENLIIKEDDISSILKYFSSTIYLDIWEKVCKKNKEFFNKNSINYKNEIIEDIVEKLFYISSNDINDYINYKNEEFTPIFNKETFEIKRNEVSKNKTMKSLLLIIKEINPILFGFIKNKSISKLRLKISNIFLIKKLWNTLEIKDNGVVEFSNKSVVELENLLENNPNIFSCFNSEILDYYSLLKSYKIKNLEKIEKLLNIILTKKDI